MALWGFSGGFFLFAFADNHIFLGQFFLFFFPLKSKGGVELNFQLICDSEGQALSFGKFPCEGRAVMALCS